MFFEQEPEPWLPWCRHRVVIKKQDGSVRQAVAMVEFARKMPAGEVQALVFPELPATDVPAGSRIRVLSVLDAGRPGMRIAFDLDGTLVPDGRRLEPGIDRPSILSRLCFRERLRRGTKELLRELQSQGHEIWIYTTSLRSPAYVRWLFRLSGAPVSRVINQQRHRLAVAGLASGQRPSKHPPSFGIDLLIDDSAGVAAEGREHGFRVVLVDPGDASWAVRVRQAVTHEGRRFGAGLLRVLPIEVEDPRSLRVPAWEAPGRRRPPCVDRPDS